MVSSILWQWARYMIRNVFTCVTGKFLLVFSASLNLSYHSPVKRGLLLLVLKEDFYCLSAMIPWIRVLIISNLVQILKGYVVCILLPQQASRTFSLGTSSGKFSLLGLGKSGNRVPPGAAVTHELVPWLVFCREWPWVLSSASVLLYDWLKLT